MIMCLSQIFLSEIEKYVTFDACVIFTSEVQLEKFSCTARRTSLWDKCVFTYALPQSVVMTVVKTELHKQTQIHNHNPNTQSGIENRNPQNPEIRDVTRGTVNHELIRRC